MHTTNVYNMKGLIFCNWICILLHIIFFINVATSTEVTITGVINPVREEGLLSVSCTVSGLNDNDEQFTIFRTLKGSKTQVLAVNGDVLPSTEDTVFLATRHMQDGSVIYFLTITEVSKEDEGEYSCKVSTIRDGVNLALESVHIIVNYFPDDGSPTCLPNNLPALYEGDILTLNCTSEPGSPVVDIQWTKSDKVLYSTPKNTSDGKLLAELNYRVTLRDQNSMFICMITSPIFPEKVQTCHVGPLRVLSNGGGIPDADSGEVIPSVVPVTKPHPTKTIPVVNQDIKNKCAEFCAENDQSPVQWKIATLVAVATAAVFLVCGVLLFVMLKTIDKSNNNSEMYSAEAAIQREQLYTELNQKFDDKVYIALQRQALKELPSRSDTINPADMRLVRKY